MNEISLKDISTPYMGIFKIGCIILGYTANFSVKKLEIDQKIKCLEIFFLGIDLEQNV